MKLHSSALLLGIFATLTAAQNVKNVFNQIPSCLVGCAESITAEKCTSDTDLSCFCQHFIGISRQQALKAVDTPQCHTSAATCTKGEVRSGFATLGRACAALIGGAPSPAPSGGGSGGGGSGGGGSGGSGGSSSMTFNVPTPTPTPPPSITGSGSGGGSTNTPPTNPNSAPSGKQLGVNSGFVLGLVSLLLFQF